MGVKIGQTYKVKKGRERNCSNFSSADGAQYIRIKRVYGGGGLEYDILDANHCRVDDCFRCFDEDDLEYTPRSKMEKLSQFARKVFDSDTKVLIRAGFLNDDLSLTEEGEDFVLSHYLASNKKVLATEAEKLLEEEEK